MDDLISEGATGLPVTELSKSTNLLPEIAKTSKRDGRGGWDGWWDEIDEVVEIEMMVERNVCEDFKRWEDNLWRWVGWYWKREEIKVFILPASLLN